MGNYVKATTLPPRAVNSAMKNPFNLTTPQIKMMMDSHKIKMMMMDSVRIRMMMECFKKVSHWGLTI